MWYLNIYGFFHCPYDFELILNSNETIVSFFRHIKSHLVESFLRTFPIFLNLLSIEFQQGLAEVTA